MDKRIYILVAAIAVICLIIITINKCNTGTVSCKQLMLDISIPEKIIAGEEFDFTDYTPGADNWKWDFNDNTQAFEKSGKHKFDSPGDKKIKISVGGKDYCAKDTVVSITVIEPSPLPVITVDKTTVFVNEKITFKGECKGAKKWKWKFMDTGYEYDTTQTFTYTCRNEDSFKVYLTVDNSDKRGEITVTVNRRQQDKDNSYSAISDKNLLPIMKKMINVLNTSGGRSEFNSLYGSIKNSFCSSSPKIIVFSSKQNIKKEWNNLKDYCDRIGGLSNVGLKDLKTERSSSGCITKLELTEE